MNELVDTLNGYIWSSSLIYLCLGIGLYFSLRTRFLQIRHIREMVSLMFHGQSSASGLSSFQALTLSLAGRVGTGNIAGVATAIYFGGPGAVFWMWLVAFLGASTAFAESTLAQIYKEENDGQYRGGPAYYIEKGLGMKWFAWIFAVATILGTGLFLPGIQANTMAASIEQAFGVSTVVSATVMVVVLGMIIFGGLKRIATFAEIVVPFMALGYILVAAVVIGLNIEQLPAAVALIVKSAFGLEAGSGAMLGMAIQWGVKRGVFSNEAGQGTGPHPAAAAEVSHPIKQGLVQGFSVYIDTLFVCSATAFMLILTGSYNVKGVDGTLLVSGLPEVAVGPAYTQSAIDTVMPGFGSAFVAIALCFFAFTTIVTNYYIAETNVAFINRKLHRPWMMFVLKVGMMSSVLYGAVKSATLIWGLGDIGVGVMAWMNIAAMLLLQKPLLAALKDYEQQKVSGKDPVFHPKKLGINNADFWERRLANSRPGKVGAYAGAAETTE